MGLLIFKETLIKFKKNKSRFLDFARNDRTELNRSFLNL